MNFPLQPLLYIPSIAGIAIILILIGLGARNSGRHKIFLAPLILVLLWLGFQFIAQLHEPLSLEFVRLATAASTLMAFAYYIAIRIYVSSKNSYVLDVLLGIIVSVFVALDLTPIIIQVVTADIDGISIDEASPLYFVQLILTLGLFVYALYKLMRATLAQPKKFRTRNYILFVSSAQAVLLSGVATLFFAHIAAAQALIFFSGFVFCVGTFIGIFKHHLFDIRPIVIRTVSYAASLVTLAVIYFALAEVLSLTLFRDQAAYGVNLNFFNVILALILALIFQPVQAFFNRLTNKVFFRGAYDTDNFYASLNRKLASTTDLRLLLQVVANEIGQTLKSEQAFFFLFSKGPRDISVGTDSHSVLPRADALMLNDFFEQSNERRVIVAKLLDGSDPIYKLMVSHRLEVVLQLIQDRVVVGYLCLGNRLVSSYTPRDVRVLEAIEQELVIAIQNARSIDKVKELNETLQQRVSSATRELRASNAQLQRLDEAKDEFISMASHQLRTPLTSIKGYISMLMEGDIGKISPDQKHLLQEAFVSSERMVRLIGDFLNVSRLQTGKFIIEKQPVDLAKLVAREIEALEPNASARSLKFSYKRPKNFPKLSLDESKIQQVIMNFADNAIYYSKEKSTIKISLSVVANRVEFTVKDTGIGVPVAEQARLFNKFFRATNARKQRPDGTGVGLFLAKKVVDAHDGKIIFSSKENKGSTFGFSLPLAKLRVRDTD